MKIKITKEQFEKVYMNNTVSKAAFLLNVGESTISNHARRYGFRKKDLSRLHLSMKLNPEIIPGGLPSKEDGQ